MNRSAISVTPSTTLGAVSLALLSVIPEATCIRILSIRVLHARYTTNARNTVIIAAHTGVYEIAFIHPDLSFNANTANPLIMPLSYSLSRNS